MSLRASAPVAESNSKLGPLAELAGVWVGSGFDVIALPTHSEEFNSFRVKLNATHETLEFNPIGGLVPDRGLLQADIFLSGLAYLQRVSDAQTNEALHIETGMWMNVPATSAPLAPATVVRQSTVPHGDSLLAQGASLVVNGGPKIDPISSTPTGPGLKKQQLGYLEAYRLAPPPGIPEAAVANPNLVLTNAIQGQKIIKTVALQVNSVPTGGIINIPFIVKNANATKITATFYIETVKQPDGSTFLQLQYTQTVILNFLDIDWPHISVATLVKQ
jgi:hypothetical protein